MLRLSQLCWLYWTIIKMTAVTVSLQSVKCLQQTFTSNIMDDACSDPSALKSTNTMLFCVFADSFLIRTCLGILFFQSLSSHSLFHRYILLKFFWHHWVTFHYTLCGFFFSFLTLGAAFCILQHLFDSFFLIFPIFFRSLWKWFCVRVRSLHFVGC